MAERNKNIIGSFSCRPQALIILGSGLGAVADGITHCKTISFYEVLGLPRVSAPTHAGNFIFGRMNGCDVLVMQGRFHVYEGYPVEMTTQPVRWAAELGIKKMISTNLSGAINPAFSVGDFMVVEDHINLSGCTPLIWSKKENHAYVDMTDAYSPKWIHLLEKSARKTGVRLQKGVLAYLTGPSFETRAELRMLKTLGADAVGWSLVPEILEARRCRMESCGIVCISDLADPETLRPVDLSALYKAGGDSVPRLKKLIFEFISRI